MTLLGYIAEAFPSDTSLVSLIVTFSVASIVIFTTILAVWRLYLSPLAKIPGPKLAALTQWYETYFEIVKGDGGQFLFECRKWHEKYGMCVFLSRGYSLSHLPYWSAEDLISDMSKDL